MRSVTKFRGSTAPTTRRLDGRFASEAAARSAVGPVVVADALEPLRAEHAALEALFVEFEDSSTRTRARRSIVDRIVEHLTRHVEIEETTLYPWARSVLPDGSTSVFDSLEEHQLMMNVVDELRSSSIADERFDAKVRVLIEFTRHHMWEEEAGIFVDVLDATDADGEYELTCAIRRAHRRVA